MTAHAMPGDRELCLQAGMSDYLTKPIHPDELFSMLARWIAAPVSQGPDAAAPCPQPTADQRRALLPDSLPPGSRSKPGC